jgi:CHASE2 domain-containing sensor protein
MQDAAPEKRRRKRRRRPRPHLNSFLGYGAALALVVLGPWLVPALLTGGDESVGGAALSKLAEYRAWLLSDRAKAPHKDIAVITVGDDLVESYPYTTPTDRGLLATLVTEIDKLNPKAIGVDFFYLKSTEPPKDRALIEAVRAARAKVILGALDKRVSLKPSQRSFQEDYLAAMGRPAGFLNLRTELDGVVRYVAKPAPVSAWPKSFTQLLTEAAGQQSDGLPGRRLAWLRPPKGQDTFLVLKAEALLPGTPQRAAAEAGGDLARLANRIVILGAAFSDRDRHKTPFSFLEGNMVGVMVHAHILAAQLDRRSFRDLTPPFALPMLLLVGGLGLWLGWSYRAEAGVSGPVALATAALIVAVDALVFSQLRLIFPFVLILLACYCGAKCGHALGRLRQDKAALTRPAAS